MRFFNCTVFAMCFLLPGGVVDGRGLYDEFSTARDEFATNVTKRLATHVERGEMAQAKSERIKTLHEKWKANKDKDSWVMFNGEIKELCRDVEVKSTVTISTFNKNNQEITGVIIKYKLSWSNEEPRTTKLQTRCDESMCIGSYYIWAERDGRAISDRNQEYPITNAKEPIRIQIEG
jgi:hypothetical protein